jgi:Protein of unknown function (DUF1549)/Protein of unknown function (DUF1553)
MIPARIFRAALVVALLAGTDSGVAQTAHAGERKPIKGGKPARTARPLRDRPFRTVAAAIDREIDARLSRASVSVSPTADDAEFLRRVYLDLVGHIPTSDQAQAFLDSTDPDRRQKLIDELLVDLHFGLHQAEVWRPLLAPRDPANTKYQPDRFSPWLADQINGGRGWDRIAVDLLGAEGEVRNHPQTSFLMARAEQSQPQPGLLAAGVGRVFLGAQIQCAECHDHPFASWKQQDFWGLAAFFGKVRNRNIKGSPILTEDPNPPGREYADRVRPALRPGGAIVIPATGGNKGAGRVVQARFPGGKPLELDDAAPFRPRLILWLTSRDNPYFARAFVNRVWAQLFARGLVNPVDDLRSDNPGSHPELLDRLAREFVASDFDIRHLFRCICNSQAYQRTSRPVPGNEKDVELFSRMAVKPLSPEMLYDSLTLVFRVSKTPRPGKPGGKKPASKPKGKPVTKKPTKPSPEKPSGKPMGKKSGKGPPSQGQSRDEFVRFFRGPGDAGPGEFTHGIPQFLRRMNGDLFNAGSPRIAQMLDWGDGPEEIVETLYLATLSRRPTGAERSLMLKYIARRRTPEQRYAGVLWILLNSGEFVLNR